MHATTSSPAQSSDSKPYTERFVQRSEMPFSADHVYDWHARPGGLGRCTPPFVRLRLIRSNVGVVKGATAEFKIRVGGVWMTWIAEFEEPIPKRQFSDVQTRG